MKNFAEKIIALFITAAILSYSAPDVNVKGETADAPGCRINLSDKAVISAMNLTADSAVTYNGAACSARLKASGGMQTKTFSFADYGISTDWSKCKKIVMPVYSGNANGQTINMVFNKSSDSDLTSGYYLYKFTVDWTGWRVMEIPMEKFSPARGITSWSTIGTMFFNIGGWGSTDIKTGTLLYFSGIYGADADSILSDTFIGGTAIYAGSRNALTGGAALKDIGYSPEYRNGALYIPLKSCETLFGASLSETDGQTEIILADKHAIFTADGKAFDGDGIYTPNKAPYLKNGEMYAAVMDICSLFQIPCYSEKRLAVFGSGSMIDYIKSMEDHNVNEYTEYLAEALCRESTPEADTEECEKVMDRWVVSLAGNGELNNLSDPWIQANINSVVSNAGTYRSRLIKSSGAAELFTDIVSDESADLTAVCYRTYVMTLAWATCGGRLYGDESLLEDILYSLEWIYQNCYGEDEIANTGWRDRNLYNWYDWRIGAPSYLIPALIMVRKYLTEEQIANYTACFDAISPDVYSSGANYIDACLLMAGSALLKHDTEKIMQIKTKAEKAFVYVDNGRNTESQLDSGRAKYTRLRGSGFYTDGSYIFHTLHPMNGTYGISHFKSAARYVSLFDGTAFGLSKLCTDNMADWFINSFDALSYRGAMFRMVLGRSENPNQSSCVRSAVSAALDCIEVFDEYDRQGIESIIKDYVENNTYINFYKDLGPRQLTRLTGIINGNAEPISTYNDSRIFYNMDKAVHKRDDWAVGISMSSSRIFNYECINNANENGWYLGDGRTELRIKSEASASTSDYWKYIDYYRLPGTTVDTQNRQEVSIAQGNEYLSSKDFVGGVSLDGEYSAAAMWLESYHNDTDFGRDAGSYGKKAPAHRNDLTAKKSYFMFDNSVFCLGADVNASDNNNAEVLTIVENRQSISSVLNSSGTACIGTDKIMSDGIDAYVGTDDYDLGNTSSVNFAGRCGYYFPPYESENKAAVKARRTEGVRSYFELWFSHGKNPKDSTYAYALLPGMTAEETVSYAENPEAEVLCNTEDIQCVRNNKLGITSIVFWNPGTFLNITVSEPMIVMLRKENGRYTLAACDPTQKLKSACITAEGLGLPESSDCKITAEASGSISRFYFDFENSDGRTMQAKGKTYGIGAITVNNDGSAYVPVWGTLPEEYKGITLVAAEYGPGGALKQVKPAGYDSEKPEITAAFDTAPENGSTVKFFLFNNMAAIVPLQKYESCIIAP